MERPTFAGHLKRSRYRHSNLEPAWTEVLNIARGMRLPALLQPCAQTVGGGSAPLPSGSLTPHPSSQKSSINTSEEIHISLGCRANGLYPDEAAFATWLWKASETIQGRIGEPRYYDLDGVLSADRPGVSWIDNPQERFMMAAFKAVDAALYAAMITPPGSNETLGLGARRPHRRLDWYSVDDAKLVLHFP